MRIVYFGFDLFADCFRELCEMESVEVMALYTFETDNVFEFNRDIKRIAKEKSIPVHTEKITENALQEYFDLGCELTVSAGYIHKIPILKSPQFKGINLHPALLPIGRGAWPYPCTILKGLNISGVTIHKITDRFDQGDILIKESFPIAENETLDSLTHKSQAVAKRLIKTCFENFDSLWKNAVPQNGGEYWPEPTDSDRTIRNDMTVGCAEKLVRAFGSYGVIYNGKIYRGDDPQAIEVPLADGVIKLK